MKINSAFLTQTDLLAVERGDSNYINNKGASLYGDGLYPDAVEYYRLAAAMGNVDAVSNLGYCYLYGRSLEPDTTLAIAYFRNAANRGCVDAAYKLGDIYSRDKWVEKDPELSVYYYRLAASLLVRGKWEDYNQILWNDELPQYPSLCFALGRELMPGGHMAADIRCAYQFLLRARTGYRDALANGSDFYRESYEAVLDLLADPIFDEIRAEYDEDDDDPED